MAAGGTDREAGPFAVALAREAVERYVRMGSRVEAPPDPPGVLRQPGAAFVALRVEGRLRGCVGRFTASRPRLVDEVLAAAVLAASRDPRFPPVGPDELSVLRYEVYFLGALERLTDLRGQDPRVHGLLVQGIRRRGGLLPGLPGVDTIEQQVTKARRKAGVWRFSPVRLYRFRAERHGEPGPPPDDALEPR